MSSRLDQEREKELQPKRMQYAINDLQDRGFEVEVIGETELQFQFKGHTIRFWPYSGYHNGKGIKAGRGLQNLLKQITNE